MLKWLIFWLVVAPTIALAQVPTLAVYHTAPERVAKGSPIQVLIDYQNVPKGAGLVIRVAPDVPVAEQKELGVGPAALVLQPISLSGSGRQVIEWNGKDLGCAPIDVPSWCPAFEVGRYRFEVALYSTAEFGLMGLGAALPELLTQNHSSAFDVSGSIDVERFRHLLTSTAINFLAKSMHLHSAGVRGLWGGDPDLYLKARGDISQGPEGYCATYEAKIPFTGQVTTCIPMSVVGPYGVHPARVHQALQVTASSRIAMRPGLLSYSDALAQARQLADAPYVARLKMESMPLMLGEGGNSWGRGGRTHNQHILAGGVTNWSFDVAASAWVFIIRQIKAGGQQADPDRIADKVIVRVERTGKVCVVETRSYNSPLPEGAASRPCP